MWEDWGERKRERAGHDGKGEEPSSLRPPRALYFFDYCYFYRDTQREDLRGREGGYLRLDKMAAFMEKNHCFYCEK